MAPLFGFHMPNYTFPGVPDDLLFDHLVKQVRAAEAAGFDLVTVMDHFYQIRGVGPETAPMLEAYTTLGAIAVRTTRVKLGTLVTGVTYRNPALLAKMVTTLDVVSKGRAILGIGAAWNKDEHAGYGFEFPRLVGAWTGWKRRYRSPGSCSRRSAPLSRGGSSESTARSTCLDRSRRAGRRSSSAAAARGALSASSPSTETSVTGSAGSSRI